MTYTLSRLAPGSYDVQLGGEIVASLVRSETPSRVVTWTLELLVYGKRRKMPEPFTASEHTFGTFQEAQQWLGGARVRRDAGEG
jgi:hypothetical protein